MACCEACELAARAPPWLRTAPDPRLGGRAQTLSLPQVPHQQPPRQPRSFPRELDPSRLRWWRSPARSRHRSQPSRRSPLTRLGRRMRRQYWRLPLRCTRHRRRRRLLTPPTPALRRIRLRRLLRLPLSRTTLRGRMSMAQPQRLGGCRRRPLREWGSTPVGVATCRSSRRPPSAQHLARSHRPKQRKEITPNPRIRGALLGGCARAVQHPGTARQSWW